MYRTRWPDRRRSGSESMPSSAKGSVRELTRSPSPSMPSPSSLPSAPPPHAGLDPEPEATRAASPPPSPRGIERKTRQGAGVGGRHEGDGGRTGNPTQKGERIDLSGMPADAQRFVRATLAGTLYDGLMAQIGETDRKAFKPRFFQAVLYGDPAKLRFTDDDTRTLAAAFQTAYPTVWAWIVWSKRDDYRELARRMQKKESD